VRDACRWAACARQRRAGLRRAGSRGVHVGALDAATGRSSSTAATSSWPTSSR
jgi:hypothetical protein